MRDRKCIILNPLSHHELTFIRVLTDLASALPFVAALRHNSTNPLWSHWRFEPLEATIGSNRKSVVVKPRSKGFNRKSGGDGKTFAYYICLNDLRDGGEAFKQVEMLGKDWAIKHVTQSEFASNVDAGNAKDKTSFHDGQAILAVNLDGNTAHFDPNKACDAAWPKWASP